jgi:hypothetical protein
MQGPSDATDPTTERTPRPQTDYETEDLTARDDEWSVAGEALPPRPRRAGLTRAGIALAAVLLITLGFIGGVEVQKQQGSGGGTANAAAATGPAGFQRGASGPGPAGGASDNVTVGTVSNKKGNLLYVKNSDGSLIKVKTSSSSTVNRTATTSAGAIHPGDTVVVQGTTSKSGTVTASRVTATSKTAAATRGGFAGGGFGGGGFAGGGGGAPAQSGAAGG